MKEDFPTTMSSNAAFIRSLWAVGRDSLIAKLDMTEAYRHMQVHPDDLPLQIVRLAFAQCLRTKTFLRF